MDSTSSDIFCTGVLIDRITVATAAHCFVDKEFEKSRLFFKCTYYGCTKVLVGAVLVYDADDFQVEDIYIHQEYLVNRTDFYRHDIALLKLAQPVELAPYANIAELSEDAITSPLEGQILGWGSLIHGQATSLQLFAADVQILGKNDCQNKMDAFHQNTCPCKNVALKDGNICAYGLTTRGSTCNVSDL